MPTYQPFADPPPAEPVAPPDPSMAPPAMQPAPAAPGQLDYVPLPTGMEPSATPPAPDPSAVPTSAWVGTAPAVPKKRNRISAILSIVVVVFGVAVLGYAIGSAIGIIPSNKGQIIFGTSAGSDFCSVGGETKIVNAGDPVYFAAILKHHMDGDQAVTLTVTKDGQNFGSLDEPADGTAFDCLAGKPDVLGQLDAGLYHFELHHNQDLESSGDLTVVAK